MIKKPGNQNGSILPLTLQDVSYEKNHSLLLGKINLILESGPRTIILGPNGAGKSLLMRICHGILNPTAGTVHWSIPNAIRYQSMVFQRPMLLQRNVTANIDYVLRLRSMQKKERRLRTIEAMEMTGITYLENTQAYSLSAGEQQRLALARAWATDPEVMFLDEPTANLDPTATHEVENIILDIHKSGTKIIMSTHDMAQAQRIATEVIFLHKGNILERAPVKMFFQNPVSLEAKQFLQGKLLWG